MASHEIDDTMPSVAKFYPRIHVLLARDAPLAVVFRRGPSKVVCTLLWNRTTDTFTVGQWFKGRIYERRSDISSDGKWLIYFAMDGKWESRTKGSWTAISRAPYLKALALFAKGNCWHGGGLFIGKKAYWLNDGWGHTVLRDTNEVERDTRYSPAENFGGEDLGVYYPRLMRDGWRLVDQQHLGEFQDVHIFEKPIHDSWLLRKLAHAQIDSPAGKGCYWDEHELIYSMSGRRICCPNWEWAELDRERLVWASDGKLFTGQLDDDLTNQRCLYDFNGMEFEPIKAPY